jgi:hypothetical protein
MFLLSIFELSGFTEIDSMFFNLLFSHVYCGAYPMPCGIMNVVTNLMELPYKNLSEATRFMLRLTGQFHLQATEKRVLARYKR